MTSQKLFVLFVLFILVTRGTTLNVKHREIVTHLVWRGDSLSEIPAVPCSLVLYFFSGINTVVKQIPKLSFHTTQEPVRKLALSIFPKDTTTECPVWGSNQQPCDH